METDFFKPEHFPAIGAAPTMRRVEELAAECANNVLAEHGLRVYAGSPGTDWVEQDLTGLTCRQAILIDIRPIQPVDTAEGLLRELVENMDLSMPTNLERWLYRARRLLSANLKKDEGQRSRRPPPLPASSKGRTITTPY